MAGSGLSPEGPSPQGAELVTGEDQVQSLDPESQVTYDGESCSSSGLIRVHESAQTMSQMEETGVAALQDLLVSDRGQAESLTDMQTSVEQVAQQDLAQSGDPGPDQVRVATQPEESFIWDPHTQQAVAVEKETDQSEMEQSRSVPVAE